MEQQQLAISPAGKGQRKNFLATNIAETSLTIEGIDCVIDLGLSRQMTYDTHTGLSRLNSASITFTSHSTSWPPKCWHLLPLME